MNDLKIEIYLDSATELCIASVAHPNADSQEIAKLTLDQFESVGEKNVCMQVGEIVLNILKRWHPKEFEILDVAVEDDDDELSDYGVAHYLIEKSVSGKTAAHVNSIDLLLKQESNEHENVRQFLEKSWPVIRERLQSYPA